jgi:hypothetical protein
MEKPSIKQVIPSQLQLLLHNFYMEWNCKFVSQAIYSWQSAKIPLNWTLCLSLVSEKKAHIPELREQYVSIGNFHSTPATVRRKCLAHINILMQDWKTMANSSGYKRLCKAENILTILVQVKLNLQDWWINLLCSCLHDTHFKQLQKCGHIIILACPLCFWLQIQ